MTVRKHGGKNLGKMTKEEFKNLINEEINKLITFNH
jgi:hypothetical protein